MLTIAERHPGLMPIDAWARSRAIMRIFSARDTVERLANTVREFS